LPVTGEAFATCHVAIGQNTWLGGKMSVPSTWTFLEKPTVTVGKPIPEDGEFKI
jgi:hypothetical protein